MFFLDNMFFFSEMSLLLFFLTTLFFFLFWKMGTLQLCFGKIQMFSFSENGNVFFTKNQESYFSEHANYYLISEQVSSFLRVTVKRVIFLAFLKKSTYIFFDRESSPIILHFITRLKLLIFHKVDNQLSIIGLNHCLS